MSYAKIHNLYRPEGQTILLLKECFALEKIHGTSAHVHWNKEGIHLSPGGETINRFKRCFDEVALAEKFKALGHDDVVVYGEAYGGSQQKMSHRYGPELKFVAFDVLVGGDWWLDIPRAEELCISLGIEFVHYDRVPTDLETLNACRDAPSVQAVRNGVEGIQNREGVVLRPIVEMSWGSGARLDRICAKHKRDDERETATPRKVEDPARLQVLEDAEKIAFEWVTDTRLQHVLDKMPQGIGMEATQSVIKAMINDICVEGSGEFVDSKEARAAIGKRTVELFKKRIMTIKVENA